jgi:DNA-binding FadR family transcriptional regulator
MPDTAESTEPVLGRRTRSIVDAIGASIVTGSFVPRSFLPVESELSSTYAASRSVLREAVKVLNAKGLVTARPRRGTSVTSPSQWNWFDPDVLRWVNQHDFSWPLLIEFTDVRLGIEPVAASLAARYGTDSQLDRIRQGYERMAAASRGEDDDLLSDIDFHLSILDASNNRFFGRLKPLVETALHFSIRYTDSIVRDLSNKLYQHEDLLNAILRRDPQAASAASFALLVDVRELMEKELGK